MSDEKRAFYEYHSCLMEPWDGPASIAFTDGKQIGAVLDRNGLRPSRYYVTKDGLVVMASEAGVLDIPPERVLQGPPAARPHVPCRHGAGPHRRGRGNQGKDRRPAALPRSGSTSTWLHLDVRRRGAAGARSAATRRAAAAAGLRLHLRGHAHHPGAHGQRRRRRRSARWAPTRRWRFCPTDRRTCSTTTSSSSSPRSPIRPSTAIREEIVTSRAPPSAPERNLLEPSRRVCRCIKLAAPMLTNEELAKLQALDAAGLQARVTLADPLPGRRRRAGPGEALDDLVRRRCGGDRGRGRRSSSSPTAAWTARLAPIPALLAARGRASSSHPRRHAHARRPGGRVAASRARCTTSRLLIGYGAGAINPYLAFETLDDMIRAGHAARTSTTRRRCKNYIKAAVKGVVKVMSKMGISTMQSYRGAQIFEAIGLHKDVIDHYFTGTASRIGGVGLDVIAQEVADRHHAGAFPSRPGTASASMPAASTSGAATASTICSIPRPSTSCRQAVRTGDYDDLQGILAARSTTSRTALHAARPAGFQVDRARPCPSTKSSRSRTIVKRFKTGAMSYGSISKEAHETLAIAMNRIGGKSNTGEGGEDPSASVRCRTAIPSTARSSRWPPAASA